MTLTTELRETFRPLQIEKEIKQAITIENNNPDFFNYIEEGKNFRAKRIQEAAYYLIHESPEVYFKELIDIYESYAEDLRFLGTKINISEFQKKFILGEFHLTLRTLEGLYNSCMG